MLELNINQENQLNFQVEIGGIQSEQIDGHFRLDIDGVEIGFPAIVKNENVIVNIPPLKSILKQNLKDGVEIKAQLDILADGYHLKPWEDTFIISNPLIAEATILNQEEYIPKAKLISKPKPKQKTIEEKIKSSDEIVSEVLEKLLPVLENVIKPKTTINSQRKSKVKPITEKFINPEPKTKSKIDIKNITEQEVYDYMSRAGTKNPKIQEIVYEQATAAAGSGKPYKILQQVVKLLKKKH